MYIYPEYGLKDISIHAAREGGDVLISFNAALSSISIHAAREGGDHIGFYVGKTHWISIHAAREGGDFPAADLLLYISEFQSTPPVKAATAFLPPILTV